MGDLRQRVRQATSRGPTCYLTATYVTSPRRRLIAPDSDMGGSEVRRSVVRLFVLSTMPFLAAVSIATSFSSSHAATAGIMPPVAGIMPPVDLAR